MTVALKEANPATEPKKAGSAPSQDTAKTIGSRLRQLRKSQKVTLVELAEKSGVDAATISRIETGKMTGTLESHVKLANSLGAKLTDIYSGVEEARTKDGVSVQPATERRDVYVHSAGKSSITMLTTGILSKKMMPVMVSIEPAGSTHTEENKVGTEKFLYILDGRVEASVGNAAHELKKGSTLYFDASIPHQIRNIGKTTAKCLSVVTPPVL